MDTIDRAQLEDQIRDLALKCRCEGPCGSCVKIEKLTDKLDEDDIVREIVQWLRTVDGPGFQTAASAIERRDFRKKDSPTPAVDRP